MHMLDREGRHSSERSDDIDGDKCNSFVRNESHSMPTIEDILVHL